MAGRGARAPIQCTLVFPPPGWQVHGGDPHQLQGEGEENHLLLKVVSKVEQLLEEELELVS